MLSLLRFQLFRLVLEPFSGRMRARRMAAFTSTMAIRPGLRVLDLGGQPGIWDMVEAPLDITCVNLPGVATTDHESHHTIRYVEGDACSLPGYEPGQFDLVFSNSVIEHVGNEGRRAAFAGEVRRLGAAYWIQTPSRWFPVEAHCGMPLWWFYPRGLRRFFLDRWRRDLPEWTEMVETTTVIGAGELRSLFPDGRLRREWLVFPKSMVAHRAPAAGPPTCREPKGRRWRRHGRAPATGRPSVVSPVPPGPIGTVPVAFPRRLRPPGDRSRPA